MEENPYKAPNVVERAKSGYASDQMSATTALVLFVASAVISGAIFFLTLGP